MFLRLALIALLAVLVVAAVARPSAGRAKARIYTVKQGDTLWTIASARYSGDPREAVWHLQQRNGLQGALLRPGQRLLLP